MSRQIRHVPAALGRAVVAACASILAGVAPAMGSTASVTVSNSAVGVTPRYLGFNMGHFMPGSNVAAWTDYAAPNAYRVWASANDYEMADDDTVWGDGVSTLEQFESRKTALRQTPESSTYINWNLFNFRFENRTQAGRNKVILNNLLGELHTRGIEPILQLTRTKEAYDFAGWEGKWEQWQFYYAMGYHGAKNYDIRRYMIYNEPDQNNSTATPQDYVARLQVASDAIRSAVADVNRIYGKSLVANVSGPTTKDGASTFSTWGIPALQANRTDYAGRPIDHDNFDTYDLHRYNSTGSAFASDINTLNAQIPIYNPSGQRMPVTYTEFNRYNSSSFANMAESLDTPSVFTSYAGDYLGAMSANVKGMYAFKFNQTWWDPGTGVSEPMKTGHYYVDNAAPYNVTGSTKGGEVARLITKGFKNERKRLGGTVSSSNSNFDSAFTHDPEKSNYYITTINRNTTDDYVNTIDLSAWNVAANTVVSIEEVSARRHGQVVQYATVPASQTLTLTQPAGSVWLMTVPSGPAQTASDIVASADAYVSGAAPSTNFGSYVVANVSRSAATSADEVGYMKFSLGTTDQAKVGRAILWLDGQNVASADAAILHVYGLANDAWSESTINWNNAPNLSDADAKIEGVGAGASPVGSLQFDATRNAYGVDITDYLRRHGDPTLSLAVAREQRFTGPDGTDADSSRIALRTREAGAGAPRISLFQTINPVFYWDRNGDGDFSSASSWDVPFSPDGTGVEAVFGMNVTAARTVRMDTSRTLGTLRFNHPDAGYTIAGPGLLNMRGNPGAAARVEVVSGHHTIAAPFELISPTIVDVEPVATLNVTQGIKAAVVFTALPASLTKTGAGTVAVKNVRGLSSLSVQGGTVEVVPDGGASGTSTVGRVTIAAGAKLQLNDNDLLVDYAPGNSPEQVLRQYVKDARDGATSGIFYDPGAGDVVLAVVDNADWGRSSYNGIEIDTSTIVVKYTWYGDANLDGKVTGDDYVAVDSNLGIGDSWLEGDFNMDGRVSGDDYVSIDANLGKGTPDPLAYAELKTEMVSLHAEMFGQDYLTKLAAFEAAVPEPSSTLLLIGAPLLALRRRRRQSGFA